MMRALHYWEHVFFAGLFGVIALYPFVVRDIPYVAYHDKTLSFFVLAGIAIMVTLIMYAEYNQKRTRRWAALAALSAGFLAVPFVGGASTIASPVVVVWFIDAMLSLCAFGYIIIKHLFRRVERDFRDRLPHSIVTGLAINTCALIFMALVVAFPIPLIAFFTGGLIFGSSFLPRSS